MILGQSLTNGYINNNNKMQYEQGKIDSTTYGNHFEDLHS